MIRKKLNRKYRENRLLILWAVAFLAALCLNACGEEAKPTAAPTTSSGSTAAPTGALVPGGGLNTPTASSGAATTAPSSGTTGTTAATTAAAPTVNGAAATPANVDADTLKAEVRPLLSQLWQTYKSRYIQQDGRVKDPQRADASTSEGESYALLRAFWQDDRSTFDAVLNWTTSNLQLARGDKLFAYLWGKNPDGTWKVIDKSAATDADQDIAFALLLASKKWNEPRYQAAALDILNDIWNKEVVTVNGKPYLTAGEWAPALPRPVLNPSYFSPYEYRIFARLDPEKSHNWMGLVDTSYEIIKSCTENKLDAPEGKLVPNWCTIDKQSGALGSALEYDKSFTSDYGYDAFRTMWRLALDYRWSGEKRALSFLQSQTVLLNDWKNRQRLAAVYNHAGQPVEDTEDLGIYAGSGVSLFSVIAPPQADQIVATKLLPRLRNVGQDDPDPAHMDPTKARTYYAQNWTWFGLALYVDALPNPNLD